MVSSEPLVGNPNPKPGKSPIHIGGIEVEFPYQPYGTQLAFMGRVISTLDRSQREGHCHALLESPTGTGKSLSLLCSVLAWQQSYAARFGGSSGAVGSKAAPEALSDPLNYGGGFIPEVSPSGNGFSGNSVPVQETGEGGAKKKSIPKIFYSSRTHSQISQVIREYRKTAYRVPMAVLASRKHYCTNPNVQGKEKIDEECKMLLRNREAGCREFKNVNKVKAHPSLQRGGCHEAHDIEDLLKVGEVVKGCSYYAARSMADNAQLVFCPYSYILDPVIRGAMEVDIRGSIIVLDEAHNMEDIAREAGSVDIEEEILLKLRDELEELCAIDALVYQPLYEMIQDLVSWIERKKSSLEKRDFQHYISCWTGDGAVRELQEAQISKQCFPILLECVTKAIKAATDLESDEPHLSGMSVIALEGLFSSLTFFFSRNGSHISDYQLVLQRYIKKDNRHDTGYPMHSISLWCLNPAVVFQDIANLSLSVILTSGTLAPTNSFSSELGVQFGTTLEAPHVIDIQSQVWSAIISHGSENYPLNASYKTADAYAFQDAVGKSLQEIFSVVPGGALVFFPSYKLMDKLSNRWRETGQWQRLNARKTLFIEPRSGSQDDFDSVLKGYYDAIHKGKKAEITKKRRIKKPELSQSCKMESSQGLKKEGAAFLAVCRGKVSEGIDFTDDNARVVIVVGIPFPNVSDIKVGLKKKYNDTNKSSKNLLSGSDWYCLQAFRAINQAAGRCIRHVNDYGAIILLDERYHEERNRVHISKWLRKSMKQYDSLTMSLEDLKSFFCNVKRQVAHQMDGMRHMSSSRDESFSSKLSKGPTKEKTARVSKSDHTEQKERSKLEQDAAFLRLKLLQSSQNQEPLESAVLDQASNRGYIDLDCTPEKSWRSSIDLTSIADEDPDPDICIVKETPAPTALTTSGSHTPETFSKMDNSTSTVIQASMRTPDPSSPLSVCLTYRNQAHSTALCSRIFSPKSEAAANTDSLRAEIESPVNSANSCTQKRRKFVVSPPSDATEEWSTCVYRGSVRGAIRSSAADGGINWRIDFDRQSETVERSYAVAATSSSAVCSPAVQRRRLRISCSLCKTPLCPTRNQYIPGHVISVSKFHLARLLEGRRKESAGVPVIVCDVSSLNQKLLDNDFSLAQQSQWCDDGCVFQPIFCTFCAPARNCLGVRVIAADALNTQLLNKILLFMDLLEVVEIEESEETRPKTDVTSQSYSSPNAASSLAPIKSFAYTPRQEISGGWRSTKSKLRLPRKPMLSHTDD
ncbi:hypothetical protein MLD38_012813 [Melastoma candidum]|uniref:Uncharacterized protein n=1 Tax=Melastoma candidum TaxID=119954 RepID=A0ACB9RAM3_9MYRT|nr:hypothetical protein MLD38_012813 [Melastoma candidum]